MQRTRHRERASELWPYSERGGTWGLSRRPGAYVSPKVVVCGGCWEHPRQGVVGRQGPGMSQHLCHGLLEVLPLPGSCDCLGHTGDSWGRIYKHQHKGNLTRKTFGLDVWSPGTFEGWATQKDQQSFPLVGCWEPGGWGVSRVSPVATVTPWGPRRRVVQFPKALGIDPFHVLSRHTFVEAKWKGKIGKKTDCQDFLPSVPFCKFQSHRKAGRAVGGTPWDSPASSTSPHWPHPRPPPHPHLHTQVSGG